VSDRGTTVPQFIASIMLDDSTESQPLRPQSELHHRQALAGLSAPIVLTKHFVPPVDKREQEDFDRPDVDVRIP